MINAKLIKTLNDGITKSRSQIRRFRDFEPVQGISENFGVNPLINQKGFEKMGKIGLVLSAIILLGS